MHIEALKKFCDLVETRSFTLTADRNLVSQAAVSQQIRMLEDIFNRRLLDRGRGQNEICLTSAGKVFYRESKNVLASYDTLCEEMRGRCGTIYPSIKVAAVYSVGLYELPSKLREFMKKFPLAKINLEYSRATRIVRDVLRGEVELGIIAFPEPRRELTIVPMASDRLVLICLPDNEFARCKQIKIDGLMGRDFVQFDRDLPTSKAIDKIFKSYGVKINKTAEFDNIDTIKCAVESGLGLAIVPHSSVIREEANQQLAVVRLAEKDWVRPVGMIYQHNRPLSVTTKKFLHSVQQSKSFSINPVFAESIVGVCNNFSASQNR